MKPCKFLLKFTGLKYNCARDLEGESKCPFASECLEDKYDEATTEFSDKVLDIFEQVRLKMGG